MASSKKKGGGARPKPKAKAAPKPKHKPAPVPAPKKAPAAKDKGKPAPKQEKLPPAPKGKLPAGAPAKLAVGGKPGAKPGAPAAPGAAPARPAGKKSSRRSTLLQRRGPDGQILAPLPGGTQSAEEATYLFRGVIATQKTTADVAIHEIVAKKQPESPLAQRPELERHHGALWLRFHQGPIEPGLPNRGQPKRTFQGVIERAKQRRREIGAFLRGLDVGRPESSQIDSHGEASLQSLMEWSARLEKLADADEPAQGDYGQFHRGLDQLDHTTEALIVDVEQTLRRMGGGRQKPEKDKDKDKDRDK
jgi:hypothetical protein